MKNERSYFHARNLLSIRYLCRACRSISSMGELAGRTGQLFILAGKLLTGHYGEKYWAEQRLKNYPPPRSFNEPQPPQPVRDEPRTFADNERALALAYEEKAVIVAANPSQLIVTLTHRCNLACEMCPQDGAWDLPEHTVREIIELMPYLKNISWLGGEVFLSPEFRRLFAAAAAFPGLRQDITTNALLIEDALIAELAAANVQLAVSLEGITPETYERYRKGGKFQNLISRLEALSARGGGGCALTMNFIVMHNNFREVEHILPFAKKYGFTYVSFLGLYEAPGKKDFWRAESIDDLPEAHTYLAGILPLLEQQSAKHKVGFTFQFPVRGAASAKLPCDPGAERGTKSPSPAHCALPWHTLEITGDYVRCYCYCGKWLVGDIRTQSLAEIWNGAAMQLMRYRVAAGPDAGICPEICPGLKYAATLRDS